MVPWYIGCPNRYRTRHFFNNSNTNEDIATKFEQEYVRCVRNEKEWVCSVWLFRCNILINGKIIKEIPGSVEWDTLYKVLQHVSASLKNHYQLM
jgi:hypothetical protein